MYTERVFDSFDRFQKPEIAVADLDSTILRVISQAGRLDILFRTPEPPAPDRVHHAMLGLADLGTLQNDTLDHLDYVEVLRGMRPSDMAAVEDGSLKVDLTSLGSLCASLPLQPSHSHLIATAMMLDATGAGMRELSDHVPITPILCVGIITATLSINPYCWRHPRSCRPAEFVATNGAGVDARMKVDLYDSDLLSDVEVYNTIASLSEQRMSFHRMYKRFNDLGLSLRQCKRMLTHSSHLAQCAVQWAEKHPELHLSSECLDALRSMARRGTVPAPSSATGRRLSVTLFMARLAVALTMPWCTLKTGSNTTFRNKNVKRLARQHGVNEQRCDRDDKAALGIVDMPLGTTEEHVRMVVGEDEGWDLEVYMGGQTFVVGSDQPEGDDRPYALVVGTRKADYTPNRDLAGLTMKSLPPFLVRCRSMQYRNAMTFPLDSGDPTATVLYSKEKAESGVFLSRYGYTASASAHVLMYADSLRLEKGGSFVKGLVSLPSDEPSAESAGTALILLCAADRHPMILDVTMNGVMSGIRVGNQKKKTAPIKCPDVDAEDVLFCVNSIRNSMRFLSDMESGNSNTMGDAAEALADMISDAIEEAAAGKGKGKTVRNVHVQEPEKGRGKGKKGRGKKGKGRSKKGRKESQPNNDVPLPCPIMWYGRYLPILTQDEEEPLPDEAWE
ncbi:hypothetical protein KIPB_006338 [Kipferlia bialata]|uniref:Uncharacterized protein n=1 Tax=Kipferlia bialata TaxID=797122 RepID=A0A9K3GJN9_9EUKA|nr:hypothetical protein KIPB_006338 [Kipferlia bialata]|eukprot:g6338.t1